MDVSAVAYYQFSLFLNGTMKKFENRDFDELSTCPTRPF